MTEKFNEYDQRGMSRSGGPRNNFEQKQVPMLDNVNDPDLLNRAQAFAECEE